jgi:TolA-binding protein
LLGKYSDARASLNDFVGKYPLSEKIAEGYYLLGDIDLKESKYADSITLLNRSISILPQAKWHELAAFRTAQAYFKSGHFDDSIKLFEKCARESSVPVVTGNSLLGLARNYEKKNMVEDAVKFCNEAALKCPTTEVESEACYMKARILYDNGRLDMAEAACLKDTGPRSCYALGRIYIKQGRTNEALSQLNSAINELEDPQMVSSALCAAGDIYFKKGEYENAAKSFDDLLKGYPESSLCAYAQYRLGDIFLATGKYSLAILAYQSLIANFPSAPLKDRAMLKLGIAHLKERAFSQALAQLDDLAKSFPKYKEDALYKFYLANALYNMNKYEEALDVFKSLVKCPDAAISLQSQYQIAWCQYRMGRDMEAVDSFGAFAKKYPDSGYKKDALRQGSSILLSAAQNFEKWKMPEDAARLYNRMEEFK